MTTDGPWILGISASHNGATCLLKGDEIFVAIQEERLTRTKRHPVVPCFPFLSLRYCLDYAGIRSEDLAAIVLCSQWASLSAENDVRSNPDLAPALAHVPLLRIPHHYGHALGAFATSGFNEAAILVVDGIGSPSCDLRADERQAVVTEMAGQEMISLYRASGTELTCMEKHLAQCPIGPSGHGLRRFGTLGMMFEALALQMFGDPLEAGKVMGLAPYGQPLFPVEEFFEIVDGRFDFHATVSRRFPFGEGWPAHAPSYQDLASSAQRALEQGVLYLVERLHTLCPSRRLCYAGGVALNSVANERVVRESQFSEVYIMPSADDSGPAIGAAYHGLWRITGRNTCRRLNSDALGRSYDRLDVERALKSTPALTVEEPRDVAAATADLLEAGAVVGWFQGRAEFGPRALGQRSILLDPRRGDGKQVLNMKVKFREAFRPFAPVVLQERAEDWFELDGAPSSSPFMLRVCQFRPDKQHDVPAVVHVDGTGRLQTVTGERNGIFYDLIAEFDRRTGVPMLLNTSFNTMGEPIVETPEDALWCFLATGMDCCVIGDFVVHKRPGYSSALDLRPKLAAVPERPLFSERTEGCDDAPPSFAIQTPWGPAHARVPEKFLPLLACMDERRTGWGILELLSDEGDVLRTPADLLRSLCWLRRARVVTFATDESGADLPTVSGTPARRSS